MKDYKYIVKQAIHVLLNFLLASLLISVFFFTYGVYIEKEIIKNQMAYLSEYAVQMINLSGPEIKTTVQTALKTYAKSEISSSHDKQIVENNSKIKLNAIKILGILTGAVFILVFALSYFVQFKLDFIHIINQSLVILLGIAFVEFVFLTFFASRYISVDVNKIIFTVLEIIKSNQTTNYPSATWINPVITLINS